MRRLAIAAAVWLAVCGSPPSSGAAQETDTASPVVFVCEHGAAKSVVAAALFNRLASERRLAVRAIARGTDPDAAVPAPIRDGLRAEGLTVDPAFTPTRLSASDVARARHIVVFDVSIPSADRLERWDALPAFSDGYAPASAAVRRQVERLLKELAAK